MAASSTMKTKHLSKFAVDFLNDNFSDDVKSLSGVKDIFTKMKDSKESLESQLSLASSEIPSEVDLAVSNVETAQIAIRRLQGEKESLHHNVKDQTHSLQPMVSDVTSLIEQVQHLQKYIKYLSFITKVEHLSSDIQTSILTDGFEISVESFHELKRVYTDLQETDCKHLLKFTSETINFWHKILKNKLASQFEDVLKSLGWPFVGTSLKTPPSQSPELRAHMETLFSQLLLIQLPDGLRDTAQRSEESLDNQPLLLPLQLMVKSFRKRFRFHFYGSRQTNSIDKPEWYFAQVLGWIRDHTHFLDQRVQPILSKTGHETVSAKVEFMRGMVALVTEKMTNDLPDTMYDEHTFSHLVDEAILFDRELKDGYSYPLGLPCCLSVLTLPRAFHKWIMVEKQFAGAKMDVTLASPSAWQSQYKDIADVDELKVPECGESFITLMLTITDRYKGLPSVIHKVRFLKLQLHLLEDFRIRLVQVMQGVIHDPLCDIFCAIINAAYYVTEVLQEWCNLPFFLQIQYQHLTLEPDTSTQPSASVSSPATQSSPVTQSSPTSVSSPSILTTASSPSSDLSLYEGLEDVAEELETSLFEEAIDTFNQLKTEMLKNIVKCIVLDVQSRSQAYRKDRWLLLSSQKETSLTLSSSACEMLLVLKDHLTHIQAQLSKPLFTLAWQRLTDKLDKFMLEEVILQNRFNDGGASQLEFDMTRNLFPLFGEFTNKPENYFRQVNEAIKLLTMETGTSLLMKEVLIHESSPTPGKDSSVYNALHEIGIFKLTPQTCRVLLDIKVNS
ncbi:RAD50-interacting protein 1-like [Mizuhopecten yessoensis]|uniref:RAD50-interacting protein 1 n=1 Tax=Mizuhopecten yessoensis TaxID=6573 RepID=A0A210QQ86_MIZYE|nr:RAD50-interacting protein 1-like [Mizuhopecten yessoensis]OWF50906.1 RAD50-interacting protein 1 [Mizuhopecten yessoensis]